MNLDAKTRGILHLPLEVYGESVMGSSLRYIPCKGKCRLLVFAGIHGEEPESTFLLSRCLRAFCEPFQDIAFVLCANPDGMTLGTRGNANGVDLNRNFQTSNWTAGEVLSRSVLEASRDTVLSAGNPAGPEPEVAALMRLVETLQPESVLSIHAPIGCVDAPVRTPLVDGLCKAFNLPWMPDIGYPTPGSFGTWCKERRLECVTLELPRMSLEALFDRYGTSFIDFLTQV
ncbi:MULTISPECIES: murein tripeptide amidase MpaA [unclassified Fibrobacter]|uniref:murein tripeptide amidase MpaA n=1 Tax=unclassified Fibrobacter TaxID=2634177 RepID=UPI000D6D4AC2|nr:MULTISPECIES: murein tripeptide amidase MpaA [unclassified Fibrobacter]PWJ71782.1 protein MpaA [Fibrobacter sp. UWR4]PZW73697.1 protein MpaA [Fibrobacter sp. UWR1]